MKRIIAIGLLAGMLCACGESTSKDVEKRSVSLVTPVRLEQVNQKKYPGIIREAHAISLGFKTGGQLERILVKEGDYVRKGQQLAVLDDDDYQLAVEALQIQYDQLKKEVERTRHLFEQKSVSANDYEKASAGLKQLGVQLQTEKNRLAYTRLCAPTDGYVQAVNFSPAEMVNAGSAVFTLLDVSHLEVDVDLPVKEYQKRNRFAEYVCKIDGIEKSFPMQLLSLTPKADGNQLYQLKLAFIGQPDRCLTAGMNVEVCISMTDSVSTEKLAVPLHAVFYDDNKPCVWVFGQDSTIHKRPVVLDGTDTEGHAVILKGLSIEERIVRAGVNALQDGQQIDVMAEPSETNVGGLL